MLNFLFWNLKKKPLIPLVAQLVYEHSVDVLLLAEFTGDRLDLVTSLNSIGVRTYALDTAPARKIEIAVSFSSERVRAIRDSPGVAIRELRTPSGTDVILTGVHLSSKLFQDKTEQALLATRVRGMIADAEEAAGHQRTIVVGDFNMDPFEVGLVGSECFHATMCPRIAMRGSRIVSDEARTFFYNPMWAKYAASGGEPRGTYFYRSSSPVAYFWHSFDQLLVRPNLIDHVPVDRIRILSKVGTMDLLDDEGVPNTEVGSDHLPLLFAANL